MDQGKERVGRVDAPEDSKDMSFLRDAGFNDNGMQHFSPLPLLSRPWETLQDILTLLLFGLFAVWNKIALERNNNDISSAIDFLTQKVYDSNNGFDVIANRLRSKL